ncbi:unnamed protein product [Malus baccata var. baccata]
MWASNIVLRRSRAISCHGEVKRAISGSMMGDPLGSSRVSSQKQNREGVVGTQNEQYRAMAESSPGCGGGPGRDLTMGNTAPGEDRLELQKTPFYRRFGGLGASNKRKP